MANALTTTYRLNGSRYFTAEVSITGDGSGEETATTILDPANITGKPTTFKIRAIQWQLDGFTAVLKWDADTDTHAFTISNYDGGIRFSDTGQHLVNNATTGRTGKVNITTIGLGAGETGKIIFEGQHK
jgi:hypothetical protein